MPGSGASTKLNASDKPAHSQVSRFNNRAAARGSLGSSSRPDVQSAHTACIPRRRVTTGLPARAAACFLILIGFSLATGAQPVFKPFMLFVTPLLSPPGTNAAAFTDAVFKHIREQFDTTAFQPINAPSVSRAEAMSNQKHDIIITADANDCYHPGTTTDTIVAWAKYRVGLVHSRIAYPFPKARLRTLPAEFAEAISMQLREDLCGVAKIDGGPLGIAIELVDGHAVHPPKRLLLPAGSYFVRCSYPGFKPRTDTLVVNPGAIVQKRFLLLPQ